MMSTRNVIADISAVSFNGKDVAIGTLITEKINQQLHNKGILCTSVIVQDVTYENENDELLKRNQDILAKARQHELQLKELENRTHLHDKETQLELSKVAALNKVKDMEADSETCRKTGIVLANAEAHAVRIQKLLDMGFTIDHVIELERVSQLEALASRKDSVKVVYMPSNFTGNGSYLHIKE